MLCRVCLEKYNTLVYVRRWSLVRNAILFASWLNNSLLRITIDEKKMTGACWNDMLFLLQLANNYSFWIYWWIAHTIYYYMQCYEASTAQVNSFVIEATYSRSLTSLHLLKWLLLRQNTQPVALPRNQEGQQVCSRDSLKVGNLTVKAHWYLQPSCLCCSLIEISDLYQQNSNEPSLHPHEATLQPSVEWVM